MSDSVGVVLVIEVGGFEEGDVKVDFLCCF